MKNGFLKTHKTQIIDDKNKPIRLRGVNLGGWLMMEAYFLCSLHKPAKYFKKEFTQVLGEKELKDFENSFNDHFIRESDFKNIAQLGFNCLRVPFHHNLIEKKPFKYDASGVKRLDNVLEWAGKYGLYVILDLHAVPGAQNHDWHADSDGKVEFWMSKTYQSRACALWEFLADRYKNETTLAGYDVLNEAVLSDTNLLNNFYQNVIKRIRSVDKNHILFIEGNRWAIDLHILDQFEDPNHVLSFHSYEPSEFTFNLVPLLSYPLNEKGRFADKNTLRKHLKQYRKISIDRQVPIFAGEFGVNYRLGRFGEHEWVRDNLKIFNEFGFHWTYWSYKAVKNACYPDGIYSYTENPPWVNRNGFRQGWDTFSAHWRTRKNDMIASWHTENFNKNTHVLKVLQDALR